MSEELKACPACGTEPDCDKPNCKGPVLYKTDSSPAWYVDCGCGLRVTGPSGGRANAAATWNCLPRPTPHPIANAGEAMREIKRMRDTAKDWRRPALQQVEGPNDLKIYGGTIADDIDRWADIMTSLLSSAPEGDAAAMREACAGRADYYQQLAQDNLNENYRPTHSMGAKEPARRIAAAIRALPLPANAQAEAVVVSDDVGGAAHFRVEKMRDGFWRATLEEGCRTTWGEGADRDDAIARLTEEYEEGGGEVGRIAMIAASKGGE